MTVSAEWLIRVDYAGRAWWVATVPMDTTIDGAEVSAEGGAEVRYSERLPRLSLDGPDTGATFEAGFPDADFAALRSAGHRWRHATGALYLVIVTDGEPGEPSAVVAGRLEAVEYADADAPAGHLRATIRAGRLTDTARLPIELLTVEAWPDLATPASGAVLAGVAGKAPALIVGRPGLIAGSPAAASPAYPVEWALGPVATRLVLASARLAEADVWLTDGSGEWRLCAVEHVADATGRTWPTIDATGIATGATPHLDRAIGTQWWWASSSATGPGSLAVSSARPGLGSVALALLAYSSLPIDRARMAAAVEILDHVEVHAVLQDLDASPLEVVQDLLAIYPCTLARSADGLYIIPHDPPLPVACRWHLVDEVDVQRVGPVDVEMVRAPASVEVRWGPSHADDTLTRAVRIDADTPALGIDLDPDGEAVTIDAPMLWDEASAWQVALLAVQARPLEREVVTIEAAPRYHAVALGDWAVLASDSLGRDLVGQVVARAWVDGAWRLTLAIDDAPG